MNRVFSHRVVCQNGPSQQGAGTGAPEFFRHFANLRSASYTVNALLNQYSSRTVPGAVDVMGIALGSATVTVNSQAPYRRVEYFRKELSVDNSLVPVWQSVAVAATGETTVNGNVFVPKTPEPFNYDLDGNLTADGRWNYTWDAENRLIRMVANTAAGPQQCIEFQYDWKGRRISKKVWNNTQKTGNPALDIRFLYDGWNLVAELDYANPQAPVLLRSHAWGLDLSGSPQGAGGVGGLLLTVNSSGTHFPCFDGNGNVMALVKAADGSLSAQYEYGPFGEVLRATGPMAKANPFRFSTKYQDDETDLLYYGYRYYNGSMGRWLSRDAAAEGAGPALYEFCLNNPISHMDLLGRLVGSVKQVNYYPIFTDPPGFFSSSRGWFTDFRWDPPKDNEWALGCDCVPCRKAVWTQLRQHNGGSWKTDWGTNPGGPDGYERYTLAYDCGKNGYAEMWDQPGISGASDLSLIIYSPLSDKFISTVVCIEGKDSGKVYATVEWGYSWSYNAVPVGDYPVLQ
jgi:RHS repeat-associated protein